MNRVSATVLSLSLALAACAKDSAPEARSVGPGAARPVAHSAIKDAAPAKALEADAAVDAGPRWTPPTLTQAAAAKGRASDTRIRTLGTAIFYRVSENSKSPWQSVEVTNVFGFKKQPKIGAKVTVLPAEVAGGPLQLAVVKTKKRDEDSPVWWEVELEPVSDRSYFEMAPPPGTSGMFLGQAAVLDPAIADARLLDPASIDRADLPRGLAPAVVGLAVDSTGDRRPDGIHAAFCCEDESTNAGCDYNCSRTFLRRKGKWVQVEYSQPQ